MLVVDGVSLSFGKRRILEGVSFELPPGRIMALTGKSGSGKTSLLGIISGLLPPDGGRVLFDNRDIFRWGDFRRSRFRNRQIGFVFQFFNLLPELSSRQNIALPAVLNPSSGDIGREIDFLVEYLGLSEIIDDHPGTLSGGERQRVAIARAVINNPRLILADEPTGNLDDETAQDIAALFRTLKEKRGISIIIVTHDARIVAAADVHYHLEGTRLKKIEAPPAPRTGARGRGRR